MTEKKLKYKPNAQAKVLEDENSIVLISYTTPVVIIDKVNNTLECTGTYSRTTISHISAFMREYTKHDYAFAKNAFLNSIIVPL